MALTRLLPRGTRTAWIRSAIAAAWLVLAGLPAAADAVAGSARTATNSGTICFQRGERPGDPRVGGTLVTFAPNSAVLRAAAPKRWRARSPWMPAPAQSR